MPDAMKPCSLKLSCADLSDQVLVSGQSHNFIFWKFFFWNFLQGLFIYLKLALFNMSNDFWTYSISYVHFKVIFICFVIISFVGSL